MEGIIIKRCKKMKSLKRTPKKAQLRESHERRVKELSITIPEWTGGPSLSKIPCLRKESRKDKGMRKVQKTFKFIKENNGISHAWRIFHLPAGFIHFMLWICCNSGSRVPNILVPPHAGHIFLNDCKTPTWFWYPFCFVNISISIYHVELPTIMLLDPSCLPECIFFLIFIVRISTDIH